MVESVATPKGPRHRVICSLGNLDPGPKEQWAAMAKKMEAALSGQQALFDDLQVAPYAEQLHVPLEANKQQSTVKVQPEAVSVEEIREAGPVHVAHQMWELAYVFAVSALNHNKHRRI